jgi:hypothetical protein
MKGLDGWDALLIAFAVMLVSSVIQGWYKTWKKRKNNPYKYSEERHAITVWLPDGTKQVHVEATEVDVRDKYICIYFEDGTEIEYEGMKFIVITRKI